MAYRCDIFTFTHPYVPYSVPYAMVFSSLDIHELNVLQMTFWVTVNVAEPLTCARKITGTNPRGGNQQKNIYQLFSVVFRQLAPVGNKF